MSRQPLFPLYDRILGGTLQSLLTTWRAEGLSYESMRSRLQDMDVRVTTETVRRWCGDLGIVAPERAAS